MATKRKEAGRPSADAQTCGIPIRQQETDAIHPCQLLGCSRAPSLHIKIHGPIFQIEKVHGASVGSVPFRKIVHRKSAIWALNGAIPH